MRAYHVRISCYLMNKHEEIVFEGDVPANSFGTAANRALREMRRKCKRKKIHNVIFGVMPFNTWQEQQRKLDELVRIKTSS